MKAVSKENEIMMITTEGIIIRMPVAGISVLSRVTSGVKLMNLEPDVKVASLTKVREADTKEDDEEDEVREGAEETDADHTSSQIEELLERAQKDVKDDADHETEDV